MNILLLICAVGFVMKCSLALMCYECNSLYDPECERLHKDDRLSLLYVYCTAKNSSYVDSYQKPLCRKIEQKIKVRNNMKIIKRGCGYELYQKIEDDYCYKIKNEDHEEIVCQCFENGCNNANIKLINAFSIFLFSLIPLFWYNR